MAKPVDPRAPGARDIPVESVRGKEEPDGEEPELGKPLSREPSARSPQALKTSGTLTTRERLFLAGLVVLAVAGGALYLFRSEIAARYELRFEPVRYWKAELGRRQFGFKMSVINLEECHVDMLAARMKEPARVARMKVLGIDESSALKLVRDETASQQQVCNVMGELVTDSRERVAVAERELMRLQPR